MSENKYSFFKRHSNDEVQELRNKIKHQYVNNIYNLWISKLEWKGLDEEVKEQQANYIMRKFWSDGTISAFKIKNTNLLGYTGYTVKTLGMYDFPETVQLLNPRNVSKEIITDKELTVNKDVVIGYCLPSRKSIKEVVNYYADKITEVELVIGTNLNLHKMPFIVAGDTLEKDKLLDVVEKILNGQQVVAMSAGDLSKIQVLATQNPYILDKLQSHKKAVENELLTILGVDNNSIDKTHITMDAIDANNEEINNYDNAIKQELQFFVDRVNSTFNREISFEDKSPDVKSIREGEVNDEVDKKNLLND